MQNNQRNILNALRENVGPEMQPTVGTDKPVAIHSCNNCAGFVVETDGGLPEVCPICGDNPFESSYYGDVTTGQVQPEQDLQVSMQPNYSPDAEDVLEEAVDLLNTGSIKTYASSYRKITSLNRKGELVAVTESGIARRKLNARQRSNYRLSEKVRKSSKINTDRLSAIRLNAFMLNEARSIKRRALRTALYEGIVDPDKEDIDELINDEVDNADYTDYVEDILKDTEVAEKIAEDDSEGAVATTVTNILSDAGLEVISSEVTDSDEDHTVLSVRVVDNPDTELHTDDVVDSLEELVDGEVTVNGVKDDTGDVVDLEFVIGSSSIIEEEEYDLDEDDEDDYEDEDDGINESYSLRQGGRSRRRSNRSINRRQRFLESITVGEVPGEVVMTPESNLTANDLIDIYADLVAEDIPANLTDGVLTIPYEEEGAEGTTLTDIKDIVDGTIGEGKFELLGEKVEDDNEDEDDLDEVINQDEDGSQYAIVSTEEVTSGMLLATDGSLVDPNKDDAEDFTQLFDNREVAEDAVNGLNDPNYEVVKVEVVPVDPSINEFIERVNKLSERRLIN